MRPFRHHAAASIEDAIALAASGPGPTAWIAGGTDLLGALKDDILPDYPRALVDLKTIPRLDRIEETDGGLRIGATAKLARIARDPLVAARYPALSQALESVATPEIRNMATLGGNLCQDTRCWYYRYPHHMGGRMLCTRKGSGPCHAVKGDNRYHAVLGGKGCFAVCPSDAAVALAALDAVLEIAGPGGRRDLSIHGFYTPLGTVLAAGEILTGVRIPPLPAGAVQEFKKFALRTPVDFALVSVAVVARVVDGTCREPRIALGGVAPTPLRASRAEECLADRPLAAETSERTAAAALEDARPLSGNAYKLDVARSLLQEVLLSLPVDPRFRTR